VLVIERAEPIEIRFALKPARALKTQDVVDVVRLPRDR
jgi:hypothetical protein